MVMPYQSALVKAWNLTARVAPGRLMSPALDVDGLMASAIKSAGVRDFGEDSFREPLGKLVEALEATDNLHAFGRFYIKQMLTGLLANRLKLVDFWQRCPDVLNETIAAPLIILGLPRTGTSFLFDLLAQDPAHRYLTNWEATVAQVAPEGVYAWQDDPRRKLGRHLLRFQHYLAPHMKEIHVFHLDGPEECTSLLMQEFTTLAIAAMFEAPAYSAWLDSACHDATYRHFKRILQTLQWRYPGQRWLLKSPSHIDAIESILKVFPDARFIQMHRDPVRAVASFASLCAAFRGICSRSVDMAVVGQQAMTRLAFDFDRYLQVRQKCASSSFVDLYYNDLVTSPLDTAKLIYERFGINYSASAQADMGAYLSRERQGGASHNYQPEDFGLTAAAIRQRFKGYIDAFDIPVES